MLVFAPLLVPPTAAAMMMVPPVMTAFAAAAMVVADALQKAGSAVRADAGGRGGDGLGRARDQGPRQKSRGDQELSGYAHGVILALEPAAAGSATERISGGNLPRDDASFCGRRARG